MIPIRLEIKGLYSYREPQIIDFTKLTASGLFGIFGPVGSGKSAILEAILLALYGSTERLSDRGEKSSMINLQSDQLLILFDFSSGRNNTSVYRARYSVKRNKKDPEKISSSEHIFYKKEDSEWVPSTEKGEDIIGMSKEHFKQTVIIPQGKFREFIDMTPGPRADMMKALFGLERFDLSANTTNLLRELNDTKIRLETQLQSLEAYDTQTVNESRSKLKVLESQALDIEKHLGSAEEEYRSKEQLSKQNDSWKKLKNQLDLLLNKLPDIDKLRTALFNLKNAHTFLKPVWDQLNNALKQVESYREGIEKCEVLEASLSVEIDTQKEKEGQLKEKHSERPAREQKIRDLKKVLEINNLNVQLNSSLKKQKGKEPELKVLRANVLDLEQQINENEKELDSLITLDSDQLAEMKTATKDWTFCENQLIKVEKEINDLALAKAGYQQRLSKIKENIPQEFDSIDTFQSYYDSKLNKLLSERDQLLVKQSLSSHIHLLEDNQPCPLCGSLDHPDPILLSIQNKLLEDIDKERSGANLLLSQIDLWAKEINELEIHLSHVESDLQKSSLQLEDLKKKLTAYKELYDKKDLSTVSALQAHISTISDLIKKTAEKETELKKRRKNRDTQRGLLEKAEIELNQLVIEETLINSEIESKKRDINNPEFCEGFFLKTNEEILATINKVERDIDSVSRDLDQVQKDLTVQVGIQINNTAQLGNNKKLHREYSEKVIELNKLFNTLKEKHSFKDEAELLELFEDCSDQDALEKEIKAFDENLLLTRSKISDLEKVPGVLTFSEEEFIILSENYHALKKQNQEKSAQLVLLKNEIDNAEKKLTDKERLLKEQEILSDRERRLRELDKLFKGSGFVKFVSSIYLRELCETANKRFLKLSKNSLSIHIDDDNTFWVTDYLNGAKRRLLKSLSGGQTFQASLCLALALAEKVKALNQADQSFFFLDEGFGALDKDSLRVVFETLKSLRHENRIVGIISHVEELQEEIGVYVSIRPDQEKGSQISYSY